MMVIIEINIINEEKERGTALKEKEMKVFFFKVALNLLLFLYFDIFLIPDATTRNVHYKSKK